jgi:hypothetical protein
MEVIINGMIETVGANLLLVLVVSAVAVFLSIQKYMNDPYRKQYNEQWFARFEAHVSQRYQLTDIGWRMDIMERQFARQKGDGKVI